MEQFSYCLGDEGDSFSSCDVDKLLALVCLETGVLPSVLPYVLSNAIRHLPTCPEQIKSSLSVPVSGDDHYSQYAFFAAADALCRLVEVHRHMEEAGITHLNSSMRSC